MSESGFGSEFAPSHVLMRCGFASGSRGPDVLTCGYGLPDDRVAAIVERAEIDVDRMDRRPG